MSTFGDPLRPAFNTQPSITIAEIRSVSRCPVKLAASGNAVCCAL